MCDPPLPPQPPPTRAVNLPLPSLAGKMRGREGKRGQREEAKEKQMDF